MPCCILNRSTATTDFDKEGRKLQKLHPEGTSSLDSIWQHPSTGANLFVGNLVAAVSEKVLQSENIRRIVTCTQEVTQDSIRVYKELGVERFHYPITRFTERPYKRCPESTARFFAPLLGWVSKSLESGHSVLIHCLAGAHRAGTAGIACLMHLQGLSAKDAIIQAQLHRDCIDPYINDCGFDKLLLKLQRSLRLGLVPPAIDEAERLGFAAAFEYIFSCQNMFIRCLCCKRPRLEPREAPLETVKVTPASQGTKSLETCEGANGEVRILGKQPTLT